MKDIIWEGLDMAKKVWGGFTLAGKIVLFPPYIILLLGLGAMMLCFEAMDECWAAFKRVNAKIFLKP